MFILVRDFLIAELCNLTQFLAIEHTSEISALGVHLRMTWFFLVLRRQDKWSLEYLQQHLKTLHGSVNLNIDMTQEKQLGFIVAHVRSNRYNVVELRAIVKDLVKDINGIEAWKQASKALQDSDGSEREAQSFILRFVEAHHRWFVTCAVRVIPHLLICPQICECFATS